MLADLRSATREAHADLESRLALLEQPLCKERVGRVLVRFESFHRAWEPRVEALIKDDALLRPKRRLGRLDQDLKVLGRVAETGQGPDLSFLQSECAAWGSLYVLEGSTLGGQVINAALRRTPWAPREGLSYFNPYGRETAARWRETVSRLEAYAGAAGTDALAMVAGAQATFAALGSWLVHRDEAAR